MKKLVWTTGGAFGLALLGGIVAAPIYAGDQQQSTIVPTLAANPNYSLTKHGKLKVKPSSKGGEGGLILQLSLKGIDCDAPGPGNDGNKLGKCGPAGAHLADNHVMSLGTDSLGIKFTDIVGVRYNVEKGAALFADTGKNKITGAVFGALVSVIYGTPLGIGNVDFHQAGTVPADCNQAPLPINTCKGGGTGACGGGSGRGASCGCTSNAQCTSNVCTPNGCTNGQKYALAGIVAGSDPGLQCSANTDCGITQICDPTPPRFCVLEPCVSDAQCDQDGTGNGGSLQCGAGNTCCDPNTDVTCTGQVP